MEGTREMDPLRRLQLLYLLRRRHRHQSRKFLGDTIAVEAHVLSQVGDEEMRALLGMIHDAFQRHHQECGRHGEWGSMAGNLIRYGRALVLWRVLAWKRGGRVGRWGMEVVGWYAR